MNVDGHDHQLIITIVNRGDAEKALRASQQAGAEGGTIMYGRGAGVHEKRKVLGIAIEPEKEILLTLVPGVISTRVLQAIVEAVQLDRPGAGIAFMLPLTQVAGICHLDTGDQPG